MPTLHGKKEQTEGRCLVYVKCGQHSVSAPPWQTRAMIKKNLEESDEMASATVALESTVISHGLPRPINLEVARSLETVVREVGATPATIGIIDGELTVGLTDEQIQFLAEDENIKKISTRDL